MRSGSGAKSGGDSTYTRKTAGGDGGIEGRCGSTRGYGTLQTMSATEMMVDEAAELLGMGPWT